MTQTHPPTDESGQGGHRIECHPTEDRVVVTIGTTTLADSVRAVRLSETGYPDRYYLPRDDVRLDLLAESETHSYCPFKGTASYWSYAGDGEQVDDVAWTYPDALPDATPVEGLVCFYPRKVEVRVT